MKYLKKIRVSSPNKYELYISFFVVLIGFRQTLHLPQNYQDYLVISTALLVSLICVFNALLDAERMNWLEHVIAVLWFAILLFFTSTTIWHTAHVSSFANR